MFSSGLKSSVRAKYNRIGQRPMEKIAAHIESPERAKYLYINYYAPELFIKYKIKLNRYNLT